METFDRIVLPPVLLLLGAPLLWGCGDGSAGTDSASSAATTSITTATQSSETRDGSTTEAGSESSGSETQMETGSEAGSETDTTTTGSDSDPIFDVGHDDTDTGGEGIFCDDAADNPSNFGCEFWAVDMDQQDAFNDPASAPWGVAISSAAAGNTTIVIEINNALPGEPLDLETIMELDIPPDEVVPVVLPTRELDCGTQPNDYTSPGTCLSSRAFRITSAAPIVVYQFNVFKNTFSNDASLLLPTPALGKYYRVLGWPAGHPVPLFGIIDRSAVTIVGTEENTTVKVVPSWRIRGNPPVPAASPGQEINITLGPFDVLNLETDDGTFQDDPKKIADLTGTVVLADKPVAVFSGVESTSAPGGVIDIPTHPDW
ncbi:MAG: IgGFc-binding protein, partial [Nannocystaceae bacterium]